MSATALYSRDRLLSIIGPQGEQHCLRLFYRTAIASGCLLLPGSSSDWRFHACHVFVLLCMSGVVLCIYAVAVLCCCRYAAVVTLRSICLLFFGMLYSTMPDCIEHLIAFFIVHCSILYSVLFYRVRCLVDNVVHTIIQFFFW